MKKHLKHSKNRKRKSKSKKFDIHNENKVKIVINNDSKSKGKSRSRKVIKKSNVGYGYREYQAGVINNPSPVVSKNDENLKNYAENYNKKILLLENGPVETSNIVVKTPNKKQELKDNSKSTIKKGIEPVYVKLPKIRKGKSYELSYEGLKNISCAELKRIIKNSFPDVHDSVLSRITTKTKDKAIHDFLDELEFKKSDNTLPKNFKDQTAYSNPTFNDEKPRPLFSDDLDLDLENFTPTKDAAGGGVVYDETPDYENVKITKVKKSNHNKHQPSVKFNSGDVPNIKDDLFQEPETPQHPFIDVLAEPKDEP
jgi:hypothetical protein